MRNHKHHTTHQDLCVTMSRGFFGGKVWFGLCLGLPMAHGSVLWTCSWRIRWLFLRILFFFPDHRLVYILLSGSRCNLKSVIYKQCASFLCQTKSEYHRPPPLPFRLRSDPTLAPKDRLWEPMGGPHTRGGACWPKEKRPHFFGKIFFSTLEAKLLFGGWRSRGGG